MGRSRASEQVSIGGDVVIAGVLLLLAKARGETDRSGAGHERQADQNSKPWSTGRAASRRRFRMGVHLDFVSAPAQNVDRLSDVAGGEYPKLLLHVCRRILLSEGYGRDPPTVQIAIYDTSAKVAVCMVETDREIISRQAW